jgi:predicted nucleotidyltransferase
MTAPLTEILAALRSELHQALGSQIQSVLLFGSRARGDAHADSDIDVLIVVRGRYNYGDLIRRTSKVVSGLSLRYDVVISRAFVPAEQFDKSSSPFLLNVRREGIPI